MSRDYTVVAHLPEHMQKLDPQLITLEYSGPKVAATLFVGTHLPDGWKFVSNGKGYGTQHQSGRLVRTTMFEVSDAEQEWGASIWVKEDLGPYIW